MEIEAVFDLRPSATADTNAASRAKEGMGSAPTRAGPGYDDFND
jgi:hypothetical protein